MQKNVSKFLRKKQKLAQLLRTTVAENINTCVTKDNQVENGKAAYIRAENAVLSRN